MGGGPYWSQRPGKIKEIIFIIKFGVHTIHTYTQEAWKKNMRVGIVRTVVAGVIKLLQQENRIPGVY